MRWTKCRISMRRYWIKSWGFIETKTTEEIQAIMTKWTARKSFKSSRNRSKRARWKSVPLNLLSILLKKDWEVSIVSSRISSPSARKRTTKLKKWGPWLKPTRSKKTSSGLMLCSIENTNLRTSKTSIIDCMSSPKIKTKRRQCNDKKASAQWRATPSPKAKDFKVSPVAILHKKPTKLKHTKKPKC